MLDLKRELPGVESEKALAIIDERGDGLLFRAFGFGVEFLSEMVSAEFVGRVEVVAQAEIRDGSM